MKDIVDLRMLYPLPFARALEVLLKLSFFISQFILLGHLPLDVHRDAFFEARFKILKKWFYHKA